MKIDILTEELIPELTESEILREVITKELEDAFNYGCVIFVRYDPPFVQRLWISHKILIDHPEFEATIRNEEFWVT